jgi:hypothetical protein
MPNFAPAHKAGPRRNSWNRKLLAAPSLFAALRQEEDHAPPHCAMPLLGRRPQGSPRAKLCAGPGKPAGGATAGAHTNAASASDQTLYGRLLPSGGGAVTLPRFRFGIYLDDAGRCARASNWKYFPEIHKCCGLRPRPQFSPLLVQDYHFVRSVILIVILVLRDAGDHGVGLIFRNGYHFIAALMPRLSRCLRCKRYQRRNKQDAKNGRHIIFSPSHFAGTIAIRYRSGRDVATKRALA